MRSLARVCIFFTFLMGCVLVCLFLYCFDASFLLHRMALLCVDHLAVFIEI